MSVYCNILVLILMLIIANRVENFSFIHHYFSCIQYNYTEKSDKGTECTQPKKQPRSIHHKVFACHFKWLTHPYLNYYLLFVKDLFKAIIVWSITSCWIKRFSINHRWLHVFGVRYIVFFLTFIAQWVQIMT